LELEEASTLMKRMPANTRGAAVLLRLLFMLFIAVYAVYAICSLNPDSPLNTT
jgi:hypothetical protein